MNDRILVIEALGYKKNKAFGYQEYLFNLLTYFFENRSQFIFDKILVIIDSSQYDDFKKFKDHFTIIGFFTPTIILRLITQLILPFILRLKKTDVILFTGNYSSLIKKSKHVLVIHDLLYLRKNLLPDFLIRLQRRIFIPGSVALADTIIAISEYTKNDILRNIKTSRGKTIIKVYNYFNFEKYTINTLNYRKSINCEYFLCISSSACHKNVISILQAYEKYCINNSLIDLCLVGTLGSGNTFSYYNQLDDFVKNKIHIFSNISNQELATLYEGCEAYISATNFEGLGMPIIEAMYFNAPLILSNLDICREVTKDQAVFFNPNSFEELYQILTNYKRKTLDTRSSVLDMYSAANTSQKYIDILNIT